MRLCSGQPHRSPLCLTHRVSRAAARGAPGDRGMISRRGMIVLGVAASVLAPATGLGAPVTASVLAQYALGPLRGDPAPAQPAPDGEALDARRVPADSEIRYRLAPPWAPYRKHIAVGAA